MSKKQNGVLAGVLAAGSMIASSAMAAVPTEVTTAFTSISDTAAGILALVWPIATAVTVGFVGLKLFKKGANKAA
jgi:hypothetical protein